jgi:hypothetical protein
MNQMNSSIYVKSDALGLLATLAVKGRACSCLTQNFTVLGL